MNATRSRARTGKGQRRGAGPSWPATLAAAAAAGQESAQRAAAAAALWDETGAGAPGGAAGAPAAPAAAQAAAAAAAHAPSGDAAGGSDDDGSGEEEAGGDEEVEEEEAEGDKFAAATVALQAQHLAAAEAASAGPSRAVSTPAAATGGSNKRKKEAKSVPAYHTRPLGVTAPKTLITPELAASQAPEDVLFTQQARSYEQTLGKNTAKGYWSAIDNFWGYVDVVLTQPEREALPADVLKHKRIPCTLAERFFGWLVEKRAPATQFKKYHNALVWAQKALGSASGGPVVDPIRDSAYMKAQKTAATSRAATELLETHADTGLWASNTDHFADDEEHRKFQHYFLCDREHGSQFSLSVRGETLTILATVGRGEQISRWRLAELYQAGVVGIGPEPTKRVKVWKWISRSDKTNRYKRMESAALRAKNPIFCPVGAMSFMLFKRWDVDRHPIPDFASRGSWYKLLLFPGHGDGTKPLDYKTVNEYITGAFKSINFKASAKVVHFWRYYAAYLLDAQNCPMTIIKMLGRWEAGEFEGVYAWHLKPKEGLVAAAGFDATRVNAYRVPRSEMEPPASLLALVFAWAEAELAKVVARNDDDSLPDADKDFGAKNFLECIIGLKTVFLQDAAVLYAEYSTKCSIYQGAVFQHPDWKPYMEKVLAHIAAAEDSMQQLALVQSSENTHIQTLGSSVSMLASSVAAVQSDVAAGFARLEASCAAGFANMQRGVEERAVASAAELLGVGVGALREVLPSLRRQQPPAPSVLPASLLALPSSGAAGGAADAAAAAPPTLPPFVKFDALRTIARVVEEWETGLGGGAPLALLDRAGAEERRAYALAATMEVGTFRKELQKRRKIVQEVRRVQGAGGDLGAAIDAVQAAATAEGSLRKFYDFLSKRDAAAAAAAVAHTAAAASAALAMLGSAPAPAGTPSTDADAAA